MYGAGYSKTFSGHFTMIGTVPCTRNVEKEKKDKSILMLTAKILVSNSGNEADSELKKVNEKGVNIKQYIITQPSKYIQCFK